MACTCYRPTKWEDPGTATMCAECEERLQATCFSCYGKGWITVGPDDIIGSECPRCSETSVITEPKEPK